MRSAARGKLTTSHFGVNLLLPWQQEERLQVCLEEGVKIISFAWGDPKPYVNVVHDAGGVVLHTVGDLEEARGALDAGVDVIVAQGVEAGGHVRGVVARFRSYLWSSMLSILYQLWPPAESPMDAASLRFWH
jgi:NAD(P)H-dependent flavin oxidoreductase YrpB (nitropropane dioxygenase family)